MKDLGDAECRETGGRQLVRGYSASPASPSGAFSDAGWFCPGRLCLPPGIAHNLHETEPPNPGTQPTADIGAKTYFWFLIAAIP